MHFTTAFAAVLASVATFAVAAPTPSEPLVARSCQTATVSVALVDQAQPVASYLPGFTISQGDNRSNRKDMFAEFNTPPGSYGCQLEAYFPAGYAISNSGSDSQRRIDVFAVAGALSRSPQGIDISWNYCPAPGSLVGSVLFKSDPNQPTRVVINSFVCDRALSYRFRINSETSSAASVSFNQNSGAGVRMLYNC